MRVEVTMLSPETDQYAGGGRKGLTVERIVETARRMEEFGFDTGTTAEAGHDPYLPLAIAAEHTSRMKLGTNVAISFPRSPLVTAQIAWDLQQLSGGRFLLGIGTQVKGHNERRYAAPWTGAAGPRQREYVECMKAMFHNFRTGEKPRYQGEFYQFTLMSPFFSPGPIEYPDPPIYIAAVNKYMARLAGELCEGLRMHPISSFEHTRQVILPEVEAGARKTGRQRSDVDVVGCPFLAVSKDKAGLEAAKAAVKQRISFYASTRTYHSVLAFHGWEDVGMKLHQLSLEGKWKELPTLISDEMLEAFAIVAVGDELAPKLRERCNGIYDTLLLDGSRALMEDAAWLRRTIDELHRS